MRAYTIFDDFGTVPAEILTSAGVDLTIHPLGVPRPDAGQMKKILADYDCVILGTSQKITEDMFDGIETPRIIGTASVGVDHIRIPPEKRDLVTVFNTPAANAPSVAEYIVGAMLVARKRLAEGCGLYARGLDNKKLHKKPEDVRGTTVGFVGAGRITTRAMELLHPFGVEFLCHTDDAPMRQNLTERFGVRFVSLKELAERSDIISVNVPSTPSTAGLISGDVIAAMKDSAIFISISREQVVDLEALLAKAESNPDFYAMLDLDVFPEYTGRVNHRNVFITPHIAGGTIESRKRMFREVVEQIADYVKQKQF